MVATHRALLLVAIGISFGFGCNTFAVMTNASRSLDEWTIQRTVPYPVQYGIHISKAKHTLPLVYVGRHPTSLVLLRSIVAHVEDLVATPLATLAIASLLALALMWSLSWSATRQWLEAKAFRALTITAAAVAVVMIACSYILPPWFGRLAPYSNTFSYPDMFSATPVAFYGVILYISWRKRARYGIAIAIAFLAVSFLGAGVFDGWSVFQTSGLTI
jgi:cytochrome bd-type quinol oxidase subunit 2